jgi:hypothetical protein
MRKNFKGRKGFWGSLTPLAIGLILSLAGGRSFGYLTIDRKVNGEEFWTAPMGNDSFRNQAGNPERYVEHREEIELQLARLGIPPDRVNFFICDFYRWVSGGENEDYFLRFPPLEIQNQNSPTVPLSSFLSMKAQNDPSPFALKIFSRKKGVLARPYDTHKAEGTGSSSPAMASLPGGFFKRNERIDSSHYKEPIHVRQEGGFHAGDGFILFFFFPAPNCKDNKDHVLLIRCRFWEHQNPRELILQAIDPELKIGESKYTPADLRREVTENPDARTTIFVRELETSQGHSYKFLAINEYEQEASSFNGGGGHLHNIPNAGPDPGDLQYLIPDLQALANFYRFPRNPEALVVFWPCGREEALFRKTQHQVLLYSGNDPRHDHILVLKNPTPAPREHSHTRR